jgi:hypothetical protein
MTPEAQSKRGTANTVLIALADALLAAVMVPLGIYLTKSMIEVKTELAALKTGQFSREELITKGNMIREEAGTLRTEIVKLRAEVEIINKRLERMEDK